MHCIEKEVQIPYKSHLHLQTFNSILSRPKVDNKSLVEQLSSNCLIRSLTSSPLPHSTLHSPHWMWEMVLEWIFILLKYSLISDPRLSVKGSTLQRVKSKNIAWGKGMCIFLAHLFPGKLRGGNLCNWTFKRFYFLRILFLLFCNLSYQKIELSSKKESHVVTFTFCYFHKVNAIEFQEMNCHSYVNKVYLLFK